MSADNLAQSIVSLDNQPSTVTNDPQLYSPAEQVASVVAFARNEGLPLPTALSQPCRWSPNEWPSVVLIIARAYDAPGPDKLLLEGGAGLALQEDQTSKIRI